MNVITRTIAILAVACSVALLFYLAVTHGVIHPSAFGSFTDNLEGDRPRFERGFEGGNNPSFFRPESGHDFARERSRKEFFLAIGLLGLLRNLGIIAIITLFVAITQRRSP